MIKYYALNDDNIAVECNMEYALLCGTEDLVSNIIQQTDVSDGLMVSTIFLGMDHCFGGSESTPLLFETMLMGNTEEEEVCVRYETYVQAVEGHWNMVKRYGGSKPVSLPLLDDNLFIL